MTEMITYPGETKPRKRKVSSRYPGITYHRASKKWLVRMRTGNGVRKYLGSFESETEAAAAYRIVRAATPVVRRYGRERILNRQVCSYWLPGDLYKRLTKSAKKNKTTQSDLVRRAITVFLTLQETAEKNSAGAKQNGGQP